MTAQAFDQISAELQKFDRWVVWRLEERESKWRKVPYTPGTGERANPTDSTSWGTFQNAVQAYQADLNRWEGVGFVFNGDGIVGVDLDHVRDRQTGEIDPWAWEIVRRLNSYTEISPSGTGLHILVRGKLPQQGRRFGPIEMYESHRFFTMTGDRLEGTSDQLKDRTGELTRLHVETEADYQVMVRIKKDPDLTALWKGDTSAYRSPSEADLALCSHIARLGHRDRSQIDRLFRRSELYRDKWNERRGSETYGERTIRKALDNLEGERAEAFFPPLSPNTRPADPARLKAIPFAEFRDQPPLDWLIDHEVPARGLGVLYGPPGCGKTFQGIDYALRIAQSAPVIYVIAEGAADYAARVKAWCDRNAGSWDRFYLLPGPLNLMDPAEVDTFIAANAGIDPALIVIDTLARTMIGGDENGTRDMGVYVRNCDRLRETMGAAVLVIHHSGWNSERERGNSSLRGAADVLIEQTKGDDGQITIRCKKMRSAAEFPPYFRRLLPVGDSCVIVPAGTVDRSNLTDRERAILQTLALDLNREKGTHWSVLLQATGLKKMPLSRALKSLISRELIHPHAGRQPYRITDQGRSILQLEQPDGNSEGVTSYSPQGGGGDAQVTDRSHQNMASERPGNTGNTQVTQVMLPRVSGGNTHSPPLRRGNVLPPNPLPSEGYDDNTGSTDVDNSTPVESDPDLGLDQEDALGVRLGEERSGLYAGTPSPGRSNSAPGPNPGPDGLKRSDPDEQNDQEMEGGSVVAPILPLRPRMAARMKRLSERT